MNLGSKSSLELQQAYGTHLPVLRYLLDNFDVRSVLEFGVGRFSTALFLATGVRLTSVETDEVWLDRFHPKSSMNHRLIFHPDDNVQVVLTGECKDEQYDLALVDGPRTTRWRCVNMLMGRAKIIVIHDTDADYYEWHRILLPRGFCKLDYKLLVPWTSIVTAEQEVIAKVQSDLICIKTLSQSDESHYLRRNDVLAV